jgi:hypothetical protein
VSSGHVESMEEAPGWINTACDGGARSGPDHMQHSVTLKLRPDHSGI